MQWALITHPEQLVTHNGRLRLLKPPMSIAESCLPAATAQGWIVLAKDSDVPALPRVPSKVNPRRIQHGDSDHISNGDEA